MLAKNRAEDSMLAKHSAEVSMLEARMLQKSMLQNPFCNMLIEMDRMYV